MARTKFVVIGTVNCGGAGWRGTGCARAALSERVRVAEMQGNTGLTTVMPQTVAPERPRATALTFDPALRGLGGAAQRCR